MNFIKLIIITALLVTFSGIKAQSKFLNTIPDVKDVSLKTTLFFKDKKIEEAFTFLRTYWPIPDNEIDEVQTKSIKSLNMVEERFGKTQGILKVKEETIKDIAIRETYLVQFEKTAIRLKFTYYKTPKGWIVNSFSWDDDFDKEFK